jgi:hypothetical protein
MGTRPFNPAGSVRTLVRQAFVLVCAGAMVDPKGDGLRVGA